jgi:hypothetical protein
VFLGKIPARQNLSGIVVKLAREAGEKAKDETTRVLGIVTRDGKPVAGGGRVGAWQKRRKEWDRVNAAIERGRTVPTDGFEFVWSTAGSDGRYSLENLKPGSRFGTWYFMYEEPGRAPSVVGPVKITAKDRTLTIDIPATAGGTIEGRVEHVPPAMAGRVWVVAFDAGVIRREALVAPDGTFRLENLPSGRYGLKAGHDAYEDPHVPRAPKGSRLDPSWWEKSAEPWQGAVVATVEPGRTVRGIVVDFRPPGPIVDSPKPSEPSKRPGP